MVNCSVDYALQCISSANSSVFTFPHLCPLKTSTDEFERQFVLPDTQNKVLWVYDGESIVENGNTACSNGFCPTCATFTAFYKPYGNSELQSLCSGVNALSKSTWWNPFYQNSINNGITPSQLCPIENCCLDSLPRATASVNNWVLWVGGLMLTNNIVVIDGEAGWFFDAGGGVVLIGIKNTSALQNILTPGSSLNPIKAQMSYWMGANIYGGETPNMPRITVDTLIIPIDLAISRIDAKNGWYPTIIYPLHVTAYNLILFANIQPPFPLNVDMEIFSSGFNVYLSQARRRFFQNTKTSTYLYFDANNRLYTLSSDFYKTFSNLLANIYKYIDPLSTQYSSLTDTVNPISDDSEQILIKNASNQLPNFQIGSLSYANVWDIPEIYNLIGNTLSQITIDGKPQYIYVDGTGNYYLPTDAEYKAMIRPNQSFLPVHTNDGVFGLTDNMYKNGGLKLSTETLIPSVWAFIMKIPITPREVAKNAPTPPQPTPPNPKPDPTPTPSEKNWWEKNKTYIFIAIGVFVALLIFGIILYLILRSPSSVQPPPYPYPYEMEDLSNMSSYGRAPMEI